MHTEDFRDMDTSPWKGFKEPSKKKDFSTELTDKEKKPMRIE
jgi:hypothetical protein